LRLPLGNFLLNDSLHDLLFLFAPKAKQVGIFQAQCQKNSKVPTSLLLENRWLARTNARILFFFCMAPGGTAWHRLGHRTTPQQHRTI
jgi:hypothetical protein